MTVLLLAIMSAVLVVHFSQGEWKAKSAPFDPQVNEAISQARSLQKLGKLRDAFVVFEKHAQAGYPDAMFHVAKAYSRGWGIKPDLKKARHYFLQAVQYSYSYRGETAYGLGRLFQRSVGPDCNTIAVEWFKKALHWNYKKASTQLAFHFERGLGVGQDIDRARAYYEIAIRAGYEQAMIKFARLLVEGRYGIVPDPERARMLTELAVVSLQRKALSTSASAAKQLGRIYRDGKLVPVNLKKAQKWLLRAARMGSTGGMHDLAHLILHDPDQKSKYAEALTWLRAAAKQGHGGAMTGLGRLHLKEKYGLKQAGALTWFKMGVAVEHGGAMEELAWLYEKGLLIKKNQSEALRLARRGSRLGHSGSTRLLKKLQGAREGRKKISHVSTGI